MREVTATRLSEVGYTVREASSGLQALAALETDPCVDLVVLGFAMPGMNGAVNVAGDHRHVEAARGRVGGRVPGVLRPILVQVAEDPEPGRGHRL
ncbi:hypothetical protein PUR21_21880 [Methylorubrum rhodesianum]|uniref:Response regulatory domain-containing protein n=1 Tax=Methylorubrum rhodesianum TaxID=29427 RepID=A0ABU9ZFM7_9HYPH